MTAFDISISIELNLDTLTLSFIEPKKIYEKKIKQKYFFWGGRGGGGYGSAALQQQWEDMIQEVSVFSLFFHNSLVFLVDKIPTPQGATPYFDISNIWETQLLLFDFVIMQ